MSRRGHVLVVDDDPGIQHLLKLALEGEGHEVRIAEHGAKALELLSSWVPGLILLDLHMPDMDGWTFRERQLAMDRAAHIPLVVVAHHDRLKGDLQALKADAIFPKPFSIVALLATTQALLSRR